MRRYTQYEKQEAKEGEASLNKFQEDKENGLIVKCNYCQEYKDTTTCKEDDAGDIYCSECIEDESATQYITEYWTESIEELQEHITRLKNANFLSIY